MIEEPKAKRTVEEIEAELEAVADYASSVARLFKMLGEIDRRAGYPA